MKNSADLGGCYPPRHSALVDNTLLDLQNSSYTTVAHRGKTQLNFCSETQQSFEEHNKLFENTTMFLRTQQTFQEHNNLFQNTTIDSETQQSFPEHQEIS